jgi:hypothetical protein
VKLVVLEVDLDRPVPRISHQSTPGELENSGSWISKKCQVRHRCHLDIPMVNVWHFLKFMTWLLLETRRFDQHMDIN